MKRTPCTTTSQSIAPSHLDPKNTTVIKVILVSGSKDESNIDQDGNVWQEVYSRKQTRSSTVRVDAVHGNDANQSNQKQNKLRRNRNTIYGDKTSDQAVLFGAAQSERIWRLNKVKINYSVTKEDMKIYYLDNGVEALSVEKLPSAKYANNKDDEEDINIPLAMKVVVRYEDKDKVMSAAFWPKAMRVRGWWPAKRGAPAAATH